MTRKESSEVRRGLKNYTEVRAEELQHILL